jgi:DNA-binding protein HU-beta
MNKSEFISAIAEKSGLTKSASEKALNAFTSVVTEELSNGEKVQLVGFGTFEAVTQGARTGRNPQTGETMDIPEKVVPKFKAGKSLKEAIN